MAMINELLYLFRAEQSWILIMLTGFVVDIGIILNLLIRGIRYLVLSDHHLRRRFSVLVNNRFFFRSSILVMALWLVILIISAVVNKIWVPLKGFELPRKEPMFIQDWYAHMALYLIVLPSGFLQLWKVRRLGDTLGIHIEMFCTATCILISGLSYVPIVMWGTYDPTVGQRLESIGYRPVWIPMICSVLTHFVTFVFFFENFFGDVNLTFSLEKY